ncbi:MAG: PQQ-binding-like beta-propeller repeat protein, partial [Vicinamibacterales bacterium]
MNRKRQLLLWAVTICASVAIGSALVGGQQAPGALEKMSQDPNQWVMPLGNYSGTRHSGLSQINAQNANRLQVSWTMSTGALRGHEGQPLVIGDMMYVVTPFPNNIYAIDLNSYWRIAWKFEPQQDRMAPSVACCDVVNRGLAYADGKILASSLDTTIYALDAKTGKVLWSVKNGDPKLGQTVTSAPLVIRDKVFVGVSGGEYGVRGYVTAYDLNTGKQVWRAHSVGADNEILFDAKTIDGATQQPAGANSSMRTWMNEEWRLGGGTTWGWFTYDPQLNLLYYGSGNPGTWNPDQRPGDNKWAMTLFARNPD